MRPLPTQFEVSAVPGSARIIERRLREVNSERGFRRMLPIAFLLASALVLTACASDETRAERLYDKSAERLDHQDYRGAIEIYEQVVREYPETETARKAREDITHYRNLVGAIDNFPSHTANDLMISTARAIHQYRRKHRSYPESLDQLVPDQLDRVESDPWGRPLGYTRKGSGFELVCYGSDGEPGGSGDAADLFADQRSRGVSTLQD